MQVVTEFPILSITILLPLFGAMYILFMQQGRGLNKVVHMKYVAILSSVFTLFCSIYLLLKFDSTIYGFQFVEFYSFLTFIGLNYHLGIDGISVFFVFLTSLLTLLSIIISVFSIKEKIKEYLLCFLLMESLIIGAFSSLNLLLFYMFFESTLFPLFLIIGIWGGKNKVYASFKFFLYTFTGSVLFLITIIYIFKNAATLDMTMLTNIIPKFSIQVQQLLWLAIFITFAIKIPMIPLHSWLPDAHVEAPTGGSVMLAGILLKLGGFGLLRICLPMFPAASLYFSKMVVMLSVAAIIYASLIAFKQNDIKRVIAYSSIAHMGYVTAGIFSLNLHGIQGAIFQMLSHGIISSALFMIIGVLYDRMHTREISFYGGVAQTMPKLATIFIFIVFGSIGIPGTSGFIGELFTLFGVISTYPLFGALATSGLLFSAVYMLFLYHRIMLMEVKNPVIYTFDDIMLREKGAILPLMLLMVIIGVYPKLVLDFLTIPSEMLSNLFYNF